MVGARYVYVVDDNSEVRRSTKLMLTSSGFEVTCFATGADFLERAKDLRPGVALLDLRMPGLDGLQVLRAVIRDYSQFACVIITGHGEIEIAVRAIKIGAKDFLEKPFREAAMLEILEREFSTLNAGAAFEATRRKAETLVNKLTPREREVFNNMVHGKPNKTIAHELGISTRTVEMHRANVMTKLECSSVAEVVSLAIHGGETTATPRYPE